MLETADWIIDVGPEGGDAGRRHRRRRTPEAIAAEKRSYTRQFLKPVLARAAAAKRKKRVEAAE